MAEHTKVVHAALQSKSARVVLLALLESDSARLTNGQLADRTGLPRSTVSESLAQLGKVSLTRRMLEADGRVLFGVEDKEGALVLLSRFRTGALGLAADRFIDLWEI